MTRYLDPKNDLVFKKIFGEHPHLLKSFLNALLPLPEGHKIETLEYLQTEQVPTIPLLKRPIVDVKCCDNHGRIFIVEMQLEWTDSFMKRLLYNAASAYVRQLIKGEQYEFLNPVYGLALINAIFDPNPLQWYHHYRMIRVGSDEGKIIEGLTLVFVEIQKFPVKTTEEKQLKILWLRFMREITNLSTEVSPDLLAVPEIKEALSLAEESSYSKSELETYDRYWDSISSEKTLLNGRFNEGKAEGKAEGRAEGKIEEKKDIAKKLLLMGMDLPSIATITGLSIEEINNHLA